MNHLRQDAQKIIDAALLAAQPHTAVGKALEAFSTPDEGKVVLVAIGKAAYAMAEAACSMLGERINQGIVITKYGHGESAAPACYPGGRAPGAG